MIHSQYKFNEKPRSTLRGIFVEEEINYKVFFPNLLSLWNETMLHCIDPAPGQDHPLIRY
jgi:hypothetical protein